MNSVLRRMSPLAIAGLLLAAGTVGCERKSTSGETTSTGDIVIGEYGSLTGQNATFGISTQKGIDMAIEEINAAGGLLGGRKLRVIVGDTQSKPEEASTVVTKLITQDQVVAVLGEVASSNSLAAAPICQQAQVPMISPSSTNEKVTQVGDYIFRVCFIDPFQGEVAAKFAYDKLGARRIAILKDVKSDYSDGLTRSFSQSLTAKGGEVLGPVSYSQGDADFRAQLTQIKSMNPDAIYLPGYYTEAGLIAKQARDLGIQVPILGGDGWDSSTLWEIGGAALNNTYISNHYSIDDPSPAIQKFVADYKRRYNEAPDAIAALAYDATKVLADAITRAGTTDGPKLREAIAATSNFPGVTGVLTLNEQRNAVKPAVILKLQYENGQGTFVYQDTVKP